MDWISPFSANPSTLAIAVEESSVNIDRTTLFEMEVLEIIRSTLDRTIENYNKTLA